MKIIRNILTKSLCGDNMPKYPAKPTFHEDCILHNAQTSCFCDWKGCTRSICTECITSPLKGHCVECSIEIMAKDITPMVIGGTVGLIYDTWYILTHISSGIFGAKPIQVALYLLFELVTCTFWFYGARKWAQIGHAEKGFAQPEGLNYPLYGSWLMWHWFTRFLYYICFISFPFFIGPFVGIPVLIKTIQKGRYIKKYCKDNNK